MCVLIESLSLSRIPVPGLNDTSSRSRISSLHFGSISSPTSPRAFVKAPLTLLIRFSTGGFAAGTLSVNLRVPPRISARVKESQSIALPLRNDGTHWRYIEVQCPQQRLGFIQLLGGYVHGRVEGMIGAVG